MKVKDLVGLKMRDAIRMPEFIECVEQVKYEIYDFAVKNKGEFKNRALIRLIRMKALEPNDSTFIGLYALALGKKLDQSVFPRAIRDAIIMLGDEALHRFVEKCRNNKSILEKVKELINSKKDGKERDEQNL